MPGYPGRLVYISVKHCIKSHVYQTRSASSYNSSKPQKPYHAVFYDAKRLTSSGAAMGLPSWWSAQCSNRQ